MPTPAGGGRLIARGYVQVDLKDNTRKEMERLLARLRRQQAKVTIPVTLDPRQVAAQFSQVFSQVQRSGQSITVPVTVSSQQVGAEFSKVFSKVQQSSKPVTMPIKLDTEAVKKAQDELRQATQQLSDAFDAEAKILKKVNKAQEDLAHLDKTAFYDRSAHRRITEQLTQEQKKLDTATEDVAKAMAAEAQASRNLKSASDALAAAQKQATAATTAGTAADRAAAQQHLASAQAAAKSEAAANRVAAARDREASALGRWRVAEMALEELRGKSTATALQLMRAEEAVENAKRAHAAATRAVEDAVRAEHIALTQLETGINRVGRAYGRLPGKASLPFGAELVKATTPAMQQVLDKLHELNKAAKIQPRYEARTVIDEMGRAHTRYFKIAGDGGTFMGEVMSRNFTQSLSRGMRGINMPALMGPIATGAVAVFSSGALLAVPAFFGKIAFEAQKGNGAVAASFHKLQTDVTTSIRGMTGTLIPNFQQAFEKVGQTFKQLEPQMAVIFERLGPQIDNVTDGVTRFATSAMPGLVAASRAATTVTQGLAAGLESAGLGVSKFFTNLSVAAPEASQTLRTVGEIAQDVMAALGTLGAEVTKVFGGQIWNEAESIFDSLSNIVSDFAQGALPALGTGLEVAMNIMAGLLNVIEPFAGILGTWMGSILGVTIAVRGLSNALGVLSATRALSMFTPLTTAMNTLQRQTMNAGVAVAGWTTKMGASEATTNRVTSATSKVSGALQKVGGALPVVGVALVALGAAWQEASGKAEEMATKVTSGSQTISQAVAEQTSSMDAWYMQLLPANDAMADYATSAMGQADATRAVTAEVQNQISQMGPLEAAQTAVAMATAAHQQAVKEFGANSPQATAAAGALKEANAALAREQEAARVAAQSHTEALVEQANEMRSQVDAAFAYQDAIKKTAEAQKAATDALKAHGAGSEQFKTATMDLAKAMNDQAVAAQRRAEAANASLGKDQAAAAGAKAYTNELLRMATQSDASRAAFIQIASSMDNAGLSAISAAAQMSGLRTEIITLPDGRKVTVVAAADRAAFDKMMNDAHQASLNGATIPIKADAAVGQNVLNIFKGVINSSTGIVGIGGNDAQGQATLGGFQGAINNMAGVSHINAEDSGGRGTLTGLQGAINQMTGTSHVRAEDSQGRQTLNGLLSAMNSATGTSHINAEDSRGRGVLSGLMGAVARSTSTMGINARDMGVQALKNRLSKNSYSTHYINVVQRGAVAGATVGANRALGSIDFPSRVLPMAAGGFTSSARMMSNRLATVVKPGDFRLIGDNPRVPELFAPLEKTARTISLMKRGAELVDHVMMSKDKLRDMMMRRAAPVPGSTSIPGTSGSSGSGGSVAVTAGGGGITIQGGLTVNVQGTWDLSSPSMPRQIAQRIHEALRQYERGQS